MPSKIFNKEMQKNELVYKSDKNLFEKLKKNEKKACCLERLRKYEGDIK